MVMMMLLLFLRIGARGRIRVLRFCFEWCGSGCCLVLVRVVGFHCFREVHVWV